MDVIQSLSSFVVFYFLCLSTIKGENEDLFVVVQKIQTGYNLTCFAGGSHLNSALSWGDNNINLNFSSIFIPENENDFKCNFSSNEDCVKYWKKGIWTLNNSLKFDFGLVLDRRWEEFEETLLVTTKMKYREFLKIENPEHFSIPISVRLSESHVFLCESTIGTVSNCYFFVLNGFGSIKSVLRKCTKYKLYESFELVRNCKIITENKYKRGSIFNHMVWKHMVFSIENNTISLTFVNESTPFLMSHDDKPFQPKYLLISNGFSKKDLQSRWRIHNYYFLYTDKPGEERLGPPVVLNDESFCVSMYLFMCFGCYVELSLENNGMDQENTSFSMQGNAWQEIKFVVDNLSGTFNLKIKTSSENESPFWAIDSVRSCSVKELRGSRIQMNSIQEIYCESIMFGTKVSIKNYEPKVNSCQDDNFQDDCNSCEIYRAKGRSCQKSFLCGNIQKCNCDCTYDDNYCTEYCHKKKLEEKNLFSKRGPDFAILDTYEVEKPNNETKKNEVQKTLIQEQIKEEKTESKHESRINQTEIENGEYTLNIINKQNLNEYKTEQNQEEKKVEENKMQNNIDEKMEDENINKQKMHEKYDENKVEGKVENEYKMNQKTEEKIQNKKQQAINVKNKQEVDENENNENVSENKKEKNVQEKKDNEFKMEKIEDYEIIHEEEEEEEKEQIYSFEKGNTENTDENKIEPITEEKISDENETTHKHPPAITSIPIITNKANENKVEHITEENKWEENQSTHQPATTSIPITTNKTTEIHNNNPTETLKSSFNWKYFLSLLLLLPIIIYIIYRYVQKRHLKEKKSKKQINSIDELEGNQKLLYGINTVHERVSMHPIECNRLVLLRDLEDYVKHCFQTGDLERQYQIFRSGQIKTWNCGILSKNKSKNRYNHIIAYDETRVVLKKINGDDSDYINANYINGYNYSRAYIAAQTPKESTVIDFWRMIWENDVKLIVALTNKSDTDSEIYWTDLNQLVEFGDINVQTISILKRFNYQRRTIVLYKDVEEREIIQYHYDSSSNGLSELSDSWVQLLKEISSHPYSSPILVHCISGSGLTGVFILCDISLRMAVKEDAVDILYYLSKLRQERPEMVSQLQQYQLIHLLLLECLMTPPSSFYCFQQNDFDNISKHDIDNEFSFLNTNAAWRDKAMRDIVQKRDAVTFNSFLKKKLSMVEEREEEITFLERYRSSFKFMAVVHPKNEQGINNIWKHIYNNNIRLIICLHVTDSKILCKFWPSETNFPIEPLPDVNINVMNVSDLDFGNVHTIQICDSEKEPRIAKIIAMKCWYADKTFPENNKDLIHVSEFLTEEENSPVMVTCCDGKTSCGLFVAVSNMLEKIKTERICDICRTVRSIRRNGDEFIKANCQYQYLYQLAAEYLRSN